MVSRARRLLFAYQLHFTMWQSCRCALSLAKKIPLLSRHGVLKILLFNKNITLPLLSTSSSALKLSYPFGQEYHHCSTHTSIEEITLRKTEARQHASSCFSLRPCLNRHYPCWFSHKFLSEATENAKVKWRGKKTDVGNSCDTNTNTMKAIY